MLIRCGRCKAGCTVLIHQRSGLVVTTHFGPDVIERCREIRDRREAGQCAVPVVCGALSAAIEAFVERRMATPPAAPEPSRTPDS